MFRQYMSTPFTLAQQTEITNYINAYRAKHQSPGLTWNNNISAVSQQWSDYLLSTKQFQHSGNKLYGENLAFFQGYGSNLVNLVKIAIDAWYKEIKYYNFQKPGFSQKTGHFTCLIWKSSTQFGVGIAYDKVTRSSYITMNTYPPGNVAGRYTKNVLP